MTKETAYQIITDMVEAIESNFVEGVEDFYDDNFENYNENRKEFFDFLKKNLLESRKEKKTVFVNSYGEEFKTLKQAELSYKNDRRNKILADKNTAIEFMTENLDKYDIAEWIYNSGFWGIVFNHFEDTIEAILEDDWQDFKFNEIEEIEED